MGDPNKEEMKLAMKEALKEWMDARFAELGLWSFRTVGVLVIVALVILILNMTYGTSSVASTGTTTVPTGWPALGLPLYAPEMSVSAIATSCQDFPLTIPNGRYPGVLQNTTIVGSVFIVGTETP